MGNEATTRLPHNRALDGVRGVAVVMVLIYHLMPSWMPGGFLGVSLFFTLSGYLITQLLIETADGRTPGAQLATFWGRRLRRLAPASLACLAAVAVIGLTTDWFASPRLRGDLTWSALYSANWRFASADLGYAEAIAGAPSPVLHFWSLAIEEQFYVLFPLLVVGLVALRVRRRHLLYVFASLAVASAFAAFASSSRSMAYYGTHTRAAELLVGACLAVLAPLRSREIASRWSRRVAAVGGTASLAGFVIACGLVSDTDSSVYAGWLAVLALVSGGVVFGATKGGPVARLGRWAPLVSAGTLSYGLYLYHWPVLLILTPDRVGFGGVGLFMVRVAVTVAVALSSYRWLEQPIRRGRALRTGRWALAALPVATAATLVIAAAVPIATVGAEGELAGIDAPSGPVEFGVPPTVAVAPSVAPGATPLSAAPPSTTPPKPPIDVLLDAPSAPPDGDVATVQTWLERLVVDDRKLAVRRPPWSGQPTLTVRVVGATERRLIEVGTAGLSGDELTVEEFVVAERLAAEVADNPTGSPLMVVHVGAETDLMGGELRGLDMARTDLMAVSATAFDANALSRPVEEVLTASGDRRLRLLVIGDSTSYALASSIDRVAGDKHAVLWAGGRNCPLVPVAELRWWDGAQFDMAQCPSVDNGWPEIVEDFRPDVVLAVASVPEQSEQRYTGDDGWHVAGDDTFRYVHDVAFERIQAMAGEIGAVTVLTNSPAVGTGAMAGAQFARPDRVAAWNAQVARFDQTWASVVTLDLATLVDSVDSSAGRKLRRDGVHFDEPDLDRLVTPRFVELLGAALDRARTESRSAGCLVDDTLVLERCRSALG